jgi:hypothetical protein
MYLLPYVKQSGIYILFLTDGGMRLWESDAPCTPEEAVREYFEPNGLYGVVKPCKRDDVILFEVNTKRTRLSDFWHWLDDGAPAGADLWRPFFLLEGAGPERAAHPLGRFGSVGTAMDLLESQS